MPHRLKIKKTTVNSFFIFLLFFLNNRFCYLIDYKTISFSGIGFEDLTSILLLCIVGVTIICNFKYLNRSGRFKVEIMFTLVMFVISSIVAQLSYSQSITMGLMAQRGWIAWILMYFPLSIWVKKKKITVDGIISALYFFGVIYLGVTTLQYLLQNSVTFLYVGSRVRYGLTAYYFERANIELLFAFAAYKAITQCSKFNALISVWCLIFIIIFYKVRMSTISVIATLFVYILLYRGMNNSIISLRKTVYILATIIFMCFFTQSTIAKDILSNLSNSTDPDLTIRVSGREFYLASFFKSPVLGSGFVNVLNLKACELSGRALGINYEDNGLFGIAFYYGLMGLVWFLALFLKSFKFAKRIYKRTNNFAYLGYLMINIVSCITLAPDCFFSGLAFPVFLVILETEYDKCKLGREVRLINK